MSDWALGYSVIGGFAQWEPDRTIAALAEIGYQAVDWSVAQFDPLNDPPARLVHLVERTRAAGLDVPQFLVHQDLVAPDRQLWEERVTRTERAIDACAEAGIPSIGVLTGPHQWAAGHARIGDGISEGEAWGLALEGLERITARGDAVGVKVGLEPCWGTLVRDAYRLQYALSRLAHTSLGVTMDPSHLVLTGDDVPWFIAQWGARVVHVHIKDAIGRPGTRGVDFMFPLPGEGGVDWPGVLAALRAIQYAGPLTVEFESYALLAGPLHGDPVAAARMCFNLTQELVKGT
jgi:sugar phosphate isomerase/epimerase